MVFCSMDCWNVHLPIMNHREAYSEEKKSPVSFEAARKLEQEGKKTSATKNASAGASNPNFQSKSSIVIRRKGSPES